MSIRRCNKEKYEDLDEYEEDEYLGDEEVGQEEDGSQDDEDVGQEDDEDQDDQEAGEEEYEEEEAYQPTEQELEYFELRQRLKESIREKMKKDSGSLLEDSGEGKNNLPYDNYVSFFGPSQPVIAQRIIEESKALLENPQLAERIFKSNHCNKQIQLSDPIGPKAQANGRSPKISDENFPKSKVQMLKKPRDYSFLLSDDAEPPAHTNKPPTMNVTVSSPGLRSDQVPSKSKQLSRNNGKKELNVREESEKNAHEPEDAIQSRD